MSPEPVQPVEAGRLRQNCGKHTVLCHHPQSRERVGHRQQPDQLLRHPLGREVRQQRHRGAAGGARRGIACAGAEPRLEAVIAQHPQHVLGDALSRLADKPHAMHLKVGQAADWVVQCPVGVEIDRVDREIAARRIFGPVGVERDAGAPAIGLDVAPQTGDLEMPRRLRRVDDCGYGAMLDTGRDRLDPRLFERRDDRLGAGRRRDIDIGDRPPEQRVAHAAADKARGDPGIRQRLDDRAGWRRDHPGLRRDLAGFAFAHLILWLSLRAQRSNLPQRGVPPDGDCFVAARLAMTESSSWLDAGFDMARHDMAVLPTRRHIDARLRVAEMHIDDEQHQEQQHRPGAGQPQPGQAPPVHRAAVFLRMRRPHPRQIQRGR